MSFDPNMKSVVSSEYTTLNNDVERGYYSGPFVVTAVSSNTTNPYFQETLQRTKNFLSQHKIQFEETINKKINIWALSGIPNRNFKDITEFLMLRLQHTNREERWKGLKLTVSADTPDPYQQYITLHIGERPPPARDLERYEWSRMYHEEYLRDHITECTQTTHVIATLMAYGGIGTTWGYVEIDSNYENYIKSAMSVGCLLGIYVIAIPSHIVGDKNNPTSPRYLLESIVAEQRMIWTKLFNPITGWFTKDKIKAGLIKEQ